jgi:hypothetical protein
MTDPTVVFAEVKAILDQTIADWTAENGGPPDLLGAHLTANFSWNTADELKSSVARGLPLIQPDVIGQTPKKGASANLVLALKGMLPDGYPRMPLGGPYRTDAEIQVIIDWIDGGCK